MKELAPSNLTSRCSRVALLLAALAAGATLAACGGESEEEATQEVEDVAIGYGESDGAEACDFLSASALDQLGGESGCTRQFEGVPPAEFEIIDVTVEEDTATATVENVESEQEIELEFVDEDGEWKISSFPGLETIAPAEPPPPADGETTAPDAGTTAPEGDTTAPEDEAAP
jgi:hypothetical protein